MVLVPVLVPSVVVDMAAALACEPLAAVLVETAVAVVALVVVVAARTCPASTNKTALFYAQHVNIITRVSTAGTCFPGGEKV